VAWGDCVSFVEIAAVHGVRLRPAGRKRVARQLRAIRTLGQAGACVAEVTRRLPAVQPVSHCAVAEGITDDRYQRPVMLVPLHEYMKGEAAL